MAKDFFALERPRRISISIPGYDAKRSAGDQQERLNKQRQRTKKKLGPKPPTPVKDVEALNASLAAQPAAAPKGPPGIEPLADVFASREGNAQ